MSFKDFIKEFVDPFYEKIKNKKITKIIYKLLTLNPLDYEEGQILIEWKASRMDIRDALDFKLHRGVNSMILCGLKINYCLDFESLEDSCFMRIHSENALNLIADNLNIFFLKYFFSKKYSEEELIKIMVFIVESMKNEV